MIRFATYDDIPQLLRMGKNFHAVSGYAEFGDYEPEPTAVLLINMIDRKEVLIDTEGKYGMLGWVTVPFYMMQSKHMCTELFWWVEPEKRGSALAIRMLHCFMKTAKQRQASAVCMITLDGDATAGVDAQKTAQLYQRLNFKPKETTYVLPL